MVTPVTIEGKALGNGRCFLIAEMGVNHNGSAELAHGLVDAAAKAEVDAVKLQTFEPGRLVSPSLRKARYQLKETDEEETQSEMLQRLVLPRTAYQELQSHALERGLAFLSTPFDENSADFLDRLGVPAFKVGSGDLTNHPLLAHLASKRKPLLVSTGMSTIGEVADAVSVIGAHGDPGLALLHCVSQYPAAASDCNLQAMDTMRSAFAVPVGWSDHTLGSAIAYASVTLGADVLEKHYTLDKKLPGPDHRSSLHPDELAELVRGIRAIESSLGDGVKRVASSERENTPLVRRSLHAKKDLSAGHVIETTDIISLRPGTGIQPTQFWAVVGRTVRIPVRAGEMLEDRHLV